MSDETEKPHEYVPVTETPHLRIWSKVQKTDPRYTKKFKRGGGFQGTAINPTYVAMRATDAFGPMGLGWGINSIRSWQEKMFPLFKHTPDWVVEAIKAGSTRAVDLVPFETIHFEEIELWFIDPLTQKKGSVTQIGATTILSAYKEGGVWSDEEAAKKTRTDAMTKCLSLLGFTADVHTGLYDDNKYVNAVTREFAAQGAGQPDQRGSGGQGQGQGQGVTGERKASPLPVPEIDEKKLSAEDAELFAQCRKIVDDLSALATTEEREAHWDKNKAFVRSLSGLLRQWIIASVQKLAADMRDAKAKAETAKAAGTQGQDEPQGDGAKEAAEDAEDKAIDAAEKAAIKEDAAKPTAKAAPKPAKK